MNSLTHTNSHANTQTHTYIASSHSITFLDKYFMPIGKVYYFCNCLVSPILQSDFILLLVKCFESNTNLQHIVEQKQIHHTFNDSFLFSSVIS